MAIYKPTYCEPFLSTEDFTTITASNPLYLYCKIASSNFDVTGYRIRLLGPNNEQQFPPASPPETSLSLNSISFIEDLKLLPLNPDPSNPDTNSGRNGTFLKIPFYVGDGSKASDTNTVSRNQISNDDLTLYNGNDYKWIITLYQLEKVTGGSGDNRYRIPTNVNYYDIILTTGVIVGSTPKRIQTMPSDKILSDYYIQPVQISNLQTTAQSNLVAERAASWTHTGDITPVGSRGRIYTYDNMLGHLYPQLAVEGAWENVINRTLWLAGTDGVANGIQVFKQSNNPEDLSVTQKVDVAPHAAIPWVWATTPANESQSHGEQVYWITKTQYDDNAGSYYPFDVQQNYMLTNVTTRTSSGNTAISNPKSVLCINSLVWFVGSDNGLWTTVDGGASWSVVSLGGTSTLNLDVSMPQRLDIGCFVVFNNKIYKYSTSDAAWDSGTDAFTYPTSTTGGFNVYPVLTNHTNGFYEYVYASGSFNPENLGYRTQIGFIHGETGAIEQRDWVFPNSLENPNVLDIGPSGASSEDKWCFTVLLRQKEHINCELYSSVPLHTIDQDTVLSDIEIEAPEDARDRSEWQLVCFNTIGNRNLPCFLIVCDGAVYYPTPNGGLVDLTYVAGINPSMKNVGFTREQLAIVWTNSIRYNISFNVDGTIQNIEYITERNQAQSPISLLSYFALNPDIIQLFNGRIRLSHDGGNEWISDTTSEYQTINLCTIGAILNQTSTSDVTAVGIAQNVAPITSKLFDFLTETAQMSKNFPAVIDSQRIVLNYQSTDRDSSIWVGESYPPLQVNGSPYNGIFAPDFNVSWFSSDKTTSVTYDNGVFAKVTVYWNRTVDADTWGELLNKIVYVPTTSVGDFQGQNIQIDVDEQNNTGGIINQSLVKFIAEKPMKLYELDETNNSDINTTAMIFYNNPTAVTKEIIPANTLFLRPLNNLENGNIIKFINTDSWSAVCYQDNTVWSVQTTTPQALLPIPSAIEESKTPYSINSFFRTSDENPFSGAANPDIEILTPTVVGHRVDCSAKYTQDTFVQWRTYQWSLTSADGTEVYDQTPVGYDNDIKATFYGLKSGVTYKVVLTIETNDNRVFTEETTVAVPSGDLYQADWLTAEADCNGYYTDSETGDLGSNVVTINTHGRAGDLYKCEIWPTGEGEEPIYHLVGENVGPLVKDYNVANHRWYKYVFRYEDGNDYVIPIQTSWAGWTLTELAPAGKYGHLLSYTAESTGVWKFKYNVSAGSQTQNLSKASHDTLGRFPYFSFGRTNYESGSVTCLLGREMIPYNLAPNKSQYVYKDGQWTWEYVDATGLPSQSQIPYLRGGYTERLPNNQSGFRDLGSNEKINMLNQWKQFCASGNPKLLKDEKGNAYIVQILNTSSETQNNVYGRPEQISFEWHQIADTKSYVIQATEGVVDSHMFTFGANLYDDGYAGHITWTLIKRDNTTIDIGATPDSVNPVVYTEIKSFVATKSAGTNIKIFYTLNGRQKRQKVENETWGLDLTGPISITRITYAD